MATTQPSTFCTTNNSIMLVSNKPLHCMRNEIYQGHKKMVVSEASGTQNIFKTGKFRAGIAFTICQYRTVAFDGKQPQRAEIRIKLACVASVSIWFRSKERLVLAAPFFARSLTLVPRSLLLNHTETLATQPSIKVNKNFRLENSFRKNRTTFQMFRCCYQFGQIWSNTKKQKENKQQKQ